MANPWFRLYSEILDDEKVQMMSFEEQRHLIMLFALRCTRSTSGMTNSQIAFRLRVDETFLKRLHETFLKHGFVDEKWEITNWNKRQYLSDSSTERVRKHRSSRTMKQDETLQNVTETKMKRFPSVSVSVSDSVSAFVSVSDPDSGSELTLSHWLFEELGIVGGNSERVVAADAIRLLAKEGGTTKDAADYILQAGKDARMRGEVIDRFWFTGQKYRPAVPVQTQKQREKEARRKAFLEAPID